MAPWEVSSSSPALETARFDPHAFLSSPFMVALLQASQYEQQMYEQQQREAQIYEQQQQQQMQMQM